LASETWQGVEAAAARVETLQNERLNVEKVEAAISGDRNIRRWNQTTEAAGGIGH
jgi:hypothetical protein